MVEAVEVESGCGRYSGFDIRHAVDYRGQRTQDFLSEFNDNKAPTAVSLYTFTRGSSSITILDPRHAPTSHEAHRIAATWSPPNATARSENPKIFSVGLIGSLSDYRPT
jgi:hypothetical protein